MDIPIIRGATSSWPKRQTKRPKKLEPSDHGVQKDVLAENDDLGLASGDIDV